MKVLFNADDFGFSKGVNLGILEAFQQGVISSTSLMVNMPGFNHAIELMKQYPDLLKVGIHLVTSVEHSICKDLKTLTDKNNHFYHNQDIIKNCHIEELKKEYEAQLLRFLDTGFRPTHIDFHWCFYPAQIEAAMYLSQKYNLPIRAENKDMEQLFKNNHIRHNMNMIQDFYNLDIAQITPKKLNSLLQYAIDNHWDSCTFALHPAYVDQTLLDLSSYNIQRAKEFASLTDSTVIQFIKDNNIETISFLDV